MLELENTFDQRSDYTFKFNRNLGRHGWLRLTPAYSVKLVKDLIANATEGMNVLDPFSGTATTGLVAAEHGNNATTFDINPFLIWIGNVKCQNFSSEYLANIRSRVNAIKINVEGEMSGDNWVPPIFNIERWWAPHTLKVLASLRKYIAEEFGEPREDHCDGLPWIAFARLIIETSSAAFNHVSMSFQDNAQHYEIEHVLDLYLIILKHILDSCEVPIRGTAQVLAIDSREIPEFQTKFDKVVTSPPYPNRMSYIRELRPYMYWLKFLDEAREAGELDWKAIGGTWGIATSRLNEWEADQEGLPQSIFDTSNRIIRSDGKNGKLMGIYVLKYFHDMHMHLRSVRGILNEGATLNYIVGNSTFFGNMVDTASLLEDSLRVLGYSNIRSEIIRKRNCNKSLYEYNVSAIL